MKKLITLVVLALLISTSTLIAGNTAIGLKLGINMSSFRGDDAPDSTKSISEIVGGVFFTIPLSRIFSLQPEILFSREGSKSTENIDPNDTQLLANYKNLSDYIKLPILLKISPVMNGIIKANFFIGPYVSFLSKSNFQIEISDVIVTETDTKEFMQNLDYGLVFGVGIDFDISNSGKIVLDLRYSMGLRSINDSADFEDSIYNRGFSAMAGFAFNL